MSAARRSDGSGGRAARHTARAVLDRCGRTYAEEAGIRLRDTPQPLYQLLVLSMLLSARIRADTAVAAARELFRAGLRSPENMAGADWQERVDALGRGGYRRYDESTATMLGKGAELVRERWGGDLRRLRADADGPEEVKRRLTEVPGIGPAGAAIFLREAQGVWPDYAPFADRKVQDGARRVGLPTGPEELSGLVGEDELPRLTAGLVRVALDRRTAEDVRETAAA
ncbi:endonuclease [Streptomyces aidingensis]|uniref:Endonuclease III n=1 Tax=Streptomyces aidingensis TaxID=910347 RepID=A0A1I1LBE3_9ACTN|nr:endonuclease [Streptomyces aidingensis]SFC68328.1 Endonuclease III [Streptomyces aidingensis]